MSIPWLAWLSWDYDNKKNNPIRCCTAQGAKVSVANVAVACIFCYNAFPLSIHLSQPLSATVAFTAMCFYMKSVFIVKNF